MSRSARLNKRSLVTMLFIALAIAYVVLIIFLPAEARTLSKYNITRVQARELQLSIAVPFIAIWATGLYGYLRLEKYASKIKGSVDGQAFGLLSTGLLALALALPVSSIVSNVTMYFTHAHPNFLPSATMITNYVNLGTVLLAFYFIFKGAKQLFQLLPSFKVHTPDAEFVPALFVLASTWYAYFTLTNPARQHPTAIARTATFYLPDWLIVLTIIIPYIIVLFLGFSSVVYLRMYLRHVPGILYKRAIAYIANGTLIAISALITMRMIGSMTAWFESRTLKILLIVVYILLLFIGTGYAFIARGAKRLNEIEDVADDNRLTILKKLLARR